MSKTEDIINGLAWFNAAIPGITGIIISLKNGETPGGGCVVADSGSGAWANAVLIESKDNKYTIFIRLYHRLPAPGF